MYFQTKSIELNLLYESRFTLTNRELVDELDFSEARNFIDMYFLSSVANADIYNQSPTQIYGISS